MRLRNAKSPRQSGLLWLIAAIAISLKLNTAFPVDLVPLPSPRAAAPSTPAPDRVFLAGEDQSVLWQKTVSRVNAEAPAIRIRSPDFSQSPPGEGLIETSWVDLPAPLSRPDVRRRAVVHFIPDDGGAWLETETALKSTAPAPLPLPSATESSSLFSSRRTTVWQAAFSDPGDAAGSDKVTPAQFMAGPIVMTNGVAPPPSGDGVVTMPPVYPDAWAPFSVPAHPALSRFVRKVKNDYRNFYSCESLVCVAGAVGAAALMANTGFDTTMQNAWQQSVEPTNLGTFFKDCKPLGEGKYAVPIFATAALTGVLLEGRPTGDIVGEWGSRSLRMFAVGGPPVLFLQYATGAPRPSENLPSGSDWLPFHHNGHGASGHAFVGAIPFIAAADMVENPFAKGALYVCSTFTGFSRMTTDSHYPSQVFLGWYLAFASSLAVDQTETKFAGMLIRAVPMAMNNGTGIALEGRW